MITITSIVGARPQFVKLAPICRVFADLDGTCKHRIVHTGQHYDYGMSEVFFDELQIPEPDLDLGVGSGGHGEQTGAMLAQLEKEFQENRPAAVLVYGDTNSTLAATLAAAKLHIPIMHIEAGLRSFNRTMPEEINRVVADHCADRLYPPTVTGLMNLRNEGLEARSLMTGDVMLDAVRFNAQLAAAHSDVMDRLSLSESGYGVVTVHRPSNTDTDFFADLLQTLAEISASKLPLVFPMHPRSRARLGDAISALPATLQIIDPLGYLDMLQLVRNAQVVLTDSGGLQKEAAMLEVPCITLREETEWTETIEIGANTLVGQSLQSLRDVLGQRLQAAKSDWSHAIEECYGDGDAAGRIVRDTLEWCRENASNGMDTE